ncbi:hypothetical protein AB0G15_05850 [Streptosporangium sp. NPDC023825]|uniref:hypothetical protein n=1 Tax=Streptosporangium sp. NPDC023825 TaxID=3154909 RepID=UPI003438FC13
MTSLLQTVMPEIRDVIHGVKGRKYISDDTARTLAIMLDGVGPALQTMMHTGAITSVDTIRREITSMADKVTSVSGWDNVRDDLYGALIALDVYVCQWKKSRRPVKGWPTLSLAA